MRIMAATMLASMGLLSACDTGQPTVVAEDDPAMAQGEPQPMPESPSASSAPEDPMSPAPALPGEATPTSEPTLFNLPEVPSGDVAQDRASLTAIPARFLGQWDAPEGPCSSDSDMFLTIRPGTITFYESQGEVTAVRRGQGQPGIVVRLAMEGEGEKWTTDYAMSLVRNSEQLAVREVSQSGRGTLRRRCPPAASATGGSATGASASGGNTTGGNTTGAGMTESRAASASGS